MCVTICQTYGSMTEVDEWEKKYVCGCLQFGEKNWWWKRTIELNIKLVDGKRGCIDKTRSMTSFW